MLRVQVIAPVELRVGEVQKRYALTTKAAERHVHEADRNQRKWIRDAHAFAGTALPVPGLIVNLANVDVAAAGEGIAAAAEEFWRRERPPTISAESIAAQYRVRAILALNPRTAHLNVRVKTQRGLTRISIRDRTLADLNTVREAVVGIPGNSRFELVPEDRKTALSALFGGGEFHASRWFSLLRLRGAGVVILSVAVVCVLLVFGLRRIETSWNGGQSLIGVITDTRCAGKHEGTPELVRECVKACVRSGSDVRYALYDGTDTYNLSDQQIAGSVCRSAR